MSRDERRLAAAVAELERLYATLPTIQCKGLCGAACGPIPLTDVEARRLQVVSHRKPRTLLLLAPVVDAHGDTRRERCVYVTPADRCSVYAARPLVCRAFGLVKRMSCPRGCLPDRWLSDVDFLELAQAVERIGGGRMLVTSPGGLELHPAGGFLGIDAGASPRSDTEIEADAERTRSLRALHGGRIIAAVSHPRNDRR